MKYSQTREELMLKLINRKTPRAYHNVYEVCTYEKSINGGCAIGCDINESLSNKLDGSVDGVFKRLPKRLQKMGMQFLQTLQSIHDNDIYWVNAETAELDEDGLVWNERGKKVINNAIKEYNLKINKI